MKENKKTFQKTSNSNKGITLVALVITIVILIILATVAINFALGNNGLINRASDARSMTEEATRNEDQSIVNALAYMNEIIDGQQTIINPYEDQKYDYAYICNDGVWDNTQYTADSEITGDIIAKFYATGNQIQPPNFDYSGTIIPFVEGTEYHLVIEGTGDMGKLLENANAFDSATGWQDSSAEYLLTYMTTHEIPEKNCIIPYVTEIIICDGITNIGDFAMLGDTALKKISIPESVTSIGDYAFSECKSLANITIPESVTSIGDYAFSECTSLANITIPESVTSIGDYAFVSCTSLANITIPESVTSIGDYAFSNCTSLANITIPESVTSIGDYAFSGCTSLEVVKILTINLSNIGFYVFYDLRDNSTIYVLSEEIKTKLVDYGYEISKTTVKVVTKDEINKL